MVYRPDIDGLRSIAVLSVIFYHFHIFHFYGGFLGVDVFFVISGFLIATLAFEEIRSTGNFSFSRFWLRRARRILPVLFVVLALTALPAFFILAGSDLLSSYARSLLASVFSLSNFSFFFESGYFDKISASKPLLHTWSLAIEEQFYFIFPFLIYFCLVKLKLNKKVFLSLIIALALLSCLACLVVSGLNSSFAFYMIPTRLWELMAGVALAYYLQGRAIRLPQKLYPGIEAASAAVLLAAFIFADKNLSVVNVAVVLAALGLIYPQKGLISSVLSLKPAVFIGRLSYSLYLWHWPVLVLWTLNYGKADRLEKLFLIALVFVLSCASYFFIERPFRSQKQWRTLLKYILPAATLICGIGLFGLLARFQPLAQTPPESAVPTSYRSAAQIDRDEVLFVGSAAQADFAVIGDSHVEAIREIVWALAQKHGSSGAIIGKEMVFINPKLQRPLEGWAERQEAARAMLEYVKRHKIKTIILCGRWDSYIFVKKMRLNGEQIRNNEKEAGLALMETVAQLAQDGVRVFILEQVPYHDQPSMEIFSLRADRSRLPKYTAEVEFLRKLVHRANNPDIQLIRTAGLFKQGEDYFFVQDRKLLYRDENHLNSYGAQLLEKDLEQVFLKPGD